MSMNKVIHGAIRRDINRFLDALDAFAEGDRDRAEQMLLLGQLRRSADPAPRERARIAWPAWAVGSTVS
jgi:hypothetical protein